MATGSAKDLSGSQAETFLAASSKEAQQQFLELVGLCEEVHAMQETETVLTHEEALLMATALQHEPRDFVTRMGFEHPDRWFMRADMRAGKRAGTRVGTRAGTRADTRAGKRVKAILPILADLMMN